MDTRPLVFCTPPQLPAPTHPKTTMVATAVEETATLAGAGRHEWETGDRRHNNTRFQRKLEPLRLNGKCTANFCHPCLGSTGLSSFSFCPGRKLRPLLPTLALCFVPFATCSNVPVQHRNLVFRGGWRSSPSLLPRQSVSASRSGCSQPNWTNARPRGRTQA